jgi:hypothetical protein
MHCTRVVVIDSKDPLPLVNYFVKKLNYIAAHQLFLFGFHQTLEIRHDLCLHQNLVPRFCFFLFHSFTLVSQSRSSDCFFILFELSFETQVRQHCGSVLPDFSYCFLEADFIILHDIRNNKG